MLAICYFQFIAHRFNCAQLSMRYLRWIPLKEIEITPCNGHVILHYPRLVRTSKRGQIVKDFGIGTEHGISRRRPNDRVEVQDGESVLYRQMARERALP